MNNQHPPKWADRFLEWFCSDQLIEEIQGDLHEAFEHRRKIHGHIKASWMYISDVLSFFKPYAFEKYSRVKQFLPMYKNYLKIAIRNILHLKGFTSLHLYISTSLHLLGLSLGMTSVMLIGLYLQYEYSYDHSVPGYQRVYRLTNQYRDQSYACMLFNDYYNSTRETQLRLPEHLKKYDEVAEACHFVLSQSAIVGEERLFIESDERKEVVDNILYTNTGEEFQEIFPQKFILGTPGSAFRGINRLIISKSTAKDWFGKTWADQEILGKLFTLSDNVYELTGVVEDPPGNLHFDFNLILTVDRIPSWGAYSYIKLKPNTNVVSVIDRLNKEKELIYPRLADTELDKGITSIALPDIHFTRGTLYELKGIANKEYLITFGIVLIVILIIIWTNYTNLAIAMYQDRQKEFGMRKVMGARTMDISFQLLLESVLLAFLCFPICWLILQYTLPHFNQLMNIDLPINILNNVYTVIILISLLILFLCLTWAKLLPHLLLGEIPWFLQDIMNGKTNSPLLHTGLKVNGKWKPYLLPIHYII